MQIRTATIEDLDFLVAGNRAMARETEGIDLDVGQLTSGVRAVLEERAHGSYRILEVDGESVAQLMLTFEWSDWRNGLVWWIQSVFVPEVHRRKGYYRALYRGVLEEAHAASSAGVRLYVDNDNEKAQQVYEALGMSTHYRVYEAMFSEPQRV